MLKLNCFLLTVSISFFSFFLFNTENTISFKAITHPHDIKIDGLYNTFAISANNAFEESLTFNKQNKPVSDYYFHFFSPQTEVFSIDCVSYLKVCKLLDLNLTTRTIIYPFHSFL